MQITFFFFLEECFAKNCDGFWTKHVLAKVPAACSCREHGESTLLLDCILFRRVLFESLINLVLFTCLPLSTGEMMTGSMARVKLRAVCEIVNENLTISINYQQIVCSSSLSFRGADHCNPIFFYRLFYSS